MDREQIASGLVPLLSSQAGRCLTFTNWEDAGIKIVSVHITDLLMKPGLSVLNSLVNIRSYCNWQGELVLNAMLPPPNREDVYSIRSLYDGSLIQIDVSALFALISRLGPEKVILPPESACYFTKFWKQLPIQTKAYFHSSEDLSDVENRVGRYLVLESQKPFSQLFSEINASSEPLYIMGDFDFAEISQLARSGKCFFESDRPAQDGMQGLVYSSEGIINILDPNMTNEHKPIDSNCQCQTCGQTFTRAYLHHLLQQTPLLAQRYLIQHNIYFCQNYLIAD